MRLYASSSSAVNLEKFAGKDLWVRVCYTGFYTSSYEYIKIAAIVGDRIWYNSLNIYEVNALVGAKLTIMRGDPESVDINLDYIKQQFTAPPMDAYAFCYRICLPLDVYTTEELMDAVELLEAET